MSREREIEWEAMVKLRAALSPKVDLGTIAMTPGIAERVPEHDRVMGLLRHVAGDWGDLDPEDREANDLALREGARVLSAYKTAVGEKFWIITEADRSVTTLLLPDEY